MPEPEYDENGYAILQYPEDTPPLHYEEGEEQGYVVEPGKAINVTTTGVGISGMSVDEIVKLKDTVMDILKQLQKLPEEDVNKIGFET